MTSTNHRATTRKDYGNHHRDLSGRPNFSTSDYNDQKSSYFSEQLARLDKKNNSRKHASSPSDLKEVASRNYRKYSREYSEDSEYSENSENYSDSYSNSEREERYHKSHNKSSKKENPRVPPSKKESRENSRVLPSKNSSKISRREKSQTQGTLPSDSSKYLPSVSTPTYSLPELSNSPLKETKTKTTEENKERRRKRRRKTDFEKFDKAEEQDPSFKHDRYEKKERESHYSRLQKERVIDKRLASGRHVERMKESGELRKDFEVHHSGSKKTDKGERMKKREKRINKGEENKELKKEFVMEVKIGSSSRNKGGNKNREKKKA